jgi:hypothetical protein
MKINHIIVERERDICREESHAEKIYKEKLSASRRDWERKKKKVSFYAYRDKNEIEYKWGEIFIFI